SSYFTLLVIFQFQFRFLNSALGAEWALWRVAGNESHAGEFLKDAPQWNTAQKWPTQEEVIPMSF
ncbi:MAG: hypothetical protein ACKOF3_04420, partial [Spartobacteria bacterium]